MMYWLVGSVILFCLIFYFYFGHSAMILFYKCMKLDVRISYWELAGMKRRGIIINDLLRSAIRLKEKGIDVKLKDFELHMKSGGNIANVVTLLLNAKSKKISLSYHEAAIMDLEEIAKKRKAEANSQSTESQQIEENTEKTEN